MVTGARLRLAAVAHARAVRAGLRLPAAPAAVAFPVAHGEPLVSVVIPVHDRWRYTNACLRALAAVNDPSIPTEIIVVDDASNDRTAELLAQCTGIRVIRNVRNVGFGASCNAGAAAARGRYLHFLNNDALVSAGWLRALIDTYHGDDRVSAVASQLRLRNGKLAEAGGVIWSDGRGSNYGRGGSPRDWRYASPREVDYASGASLMVRSTDFARAGGFSAAFAPAYYEDVDLCFTLRANGGRVAYQPHSVVYHAEGVSFGSNVRSDARALQERHRLLFATKWNDRLRAHFAPNPDSVDAAARRLAGRPTVVVVDEHVPFTDRDAGSRRIFFLVEMFRRAGWHVIFGSLDGTAYQPYSDALRATGTELLCGFRAASVAQLKRRKLTVDLAWLCRPGPARRLLPAFRAAGARIVFDTVDLHYRRLEGEERVLGRATRWQTMRRRELAIARSADMTMTTSAAERDVLVQNGIQSTGVLPVIEPLPDEAPPGWDARHGLVFLGNYAHAPNVDAVRWLCAEIMPLVWERLPDLRLTLAGADPTRAVRALARPGVAVTGYVADARPLLDAARVFVAPLRYGAGVKGKIVYALAHGIAVVTTPIGAEGIFDATDDDAIATTPEAIAAHVVKLHEDGAAWERSVEAGRAIAARFTPGALETQLAAVLERLTPAAAPTGA